jgi:hypothetical protein
MVEHETLVGGGWSEHGRHPLIAQVCAGYSAA